VRAATDVTGFSLLGHLHRMLRASNVTAHVYADQVPLLPGAIELAQEGYISGGTRANMAHLRPFVDVAADVPAELSVLLHDAQTSGGLLLAIPGDGLALQRDLSRQGLTAAVIGRIESGEAGRITVHAGRTTV
jgi:selenide,water dikinase